MNSASFHAFLRSHLHHITSSDFLVHHSLSPGIAASVVAAVAPGSHGFAQPAAGPSKQQLQHHAESRRSFQHTAILMMLFRKRKEYVLRTTKREEVHYEKMEITLEAARDFIHGGEDPLSVHLNELKRKEEVERELKRARRFGAKRKAGRALSTTTPRSPAPVIIPPSIEAAVVTTASPSKTTTFAALPGEGSAHKPRTPHPPTMGSLSRGNSFKNPAPSLGFHSNSRGNSFKNSSSPSQQGHLSRGNSMKSSGGQFGGGSPVSLSRGNSIKLRGAAQGGLSQKGFHENYEGATATLRLPPPEVFLPLQAIAAEDMALLYLRVAEQLQQQHKLADKQRRRRASHENANAGDAIASALHAGTGAVSQLHYRKQSNYGNHHSVSMTMVVNTNDEIHQYHPHSHVFAHNLLHNNVARVDHLASQPKAPLSANHHRKEAGPLQKRALGNS